MYSLYPRFRNYQWFGKRDHFIENINPSRNFGLSERFKVLCESISHPEAKRCLFCVRHEQPNKKILLCLAEEGSALAVAIVGFYYYDINQQERLEWFGELLKFGRYRDFLLMIEPYVRWQIENHISLVHIGRYLIKGFDPTPRRLFKMRVHHQMFKFAERSIKCYIKQMNGCRKAVDAWTLVGLRFRVVKDIRNLIAKLIWESRNEEIYF